MRRSRSGSTPENRRGTRSGVLRAILKAAPPARRNKIDELEPQRLCFGPFDFHPATGDLRRDGAPVRLPPQPAQLLAILLARPGDIVLRDELRRQLWGDGTYVDFNRSLNFCVAQLRSALDDSPDSPRYIKTIPKRGYQFIAAVTPPENLAQPPPNGTPLPAIALMLTLAVGVFLWLWQRTPGPETIIAVARFENLTGDAALDLYAQSLQNAVIAGLTNRERFAVIGNAAILQQPRPNRDLLKIHETLHAGRIILGSLERGKDAPEVFLQFISLPGQVHLKVVRLPLPAATPASELAPQLVETLLTGPYRTR